MNYYAVFLEMLDPEKSQKYRPEHLDYLAKMREQDRIFVYGRLSDGAGGLVIYQGNSQDEVEEWVKNDPYIKTGARGYDIHPWDMQSDYTFQK